MPGTVRMEDLTVLGKRAVMAFDAAFPAKEKCTDTPTQRRLIEVMAMQRPFEKGDKS